MTPPVSGTHDRPDVPERILSAFETIYSTDLVYQKDCWQLCGDAHCCSFSRYKSQFRLIARNPFQELPLLPGEYEFLESKGWLGQFGDFDHKVVQYPAGRFCFRAEAIVSRRPQCACDHAIRTTVCRLYPLLPVFDFHRETPALAGVEPLGIYEEMEEIAGLPRACQLTSIPFDQMGPFLRITEALARNPEHLLYLEAYRLTKAHAAANIAHRFATAKGRAPNVFHLFEGALLRDQVIEDERLHPALEALAGRFAARFGAGLSDAYIGAASGQALTAGA